MQPAEIAQLDRALAKNGSTIVLRRYAAGNSARFDVTVKASVRPVKAEEIVGSITQTSMTVILSPTEMTRAQWPGYQTGVTGPESRMPRTGDKAVIDGRERNIQFVKPIYVADVLVRIELNVAG